MSLCLKKIIRQGDNLFYQRAIPPVSVVSGKAADHLTRAKAYSNTAAFGSISSLYLCNIHES